MNNSPLATPVKLLLVDDECQQLTLRTTIFAMAGFSVLSATDPVEALSLFANCGGIDIAILDYEMPVMNGGALARRLKTSCPKLHIVLHSSALAIDSDDMNYFDSLVPKGEGICVLLHHVSNLSAEVTAARRRLGAEPGYIEPSTSLEVDFRRAARSALAPTTAL